jgi:hypothetical protein
MNPQTKSGAVVTEADHIEIGDICEKCTLKRSMLRTDDLGQVKSKGTVQRCATKVMISCLHLYFCLHSFSKTLRHILCVNMNLSEERKFSLGFLHNFN